MYLLICSVLLMTSTNIMCAPAVKQVTLPGSQVAAEIEPRFDIFDLFDWASSVDNDYYTYDYGNDYIIGDPQGLYAHVIFSS